MVELDQTIYCRPPDNGGRKPKIRVPKRAGINKIKKAEGVLTDNHKRFTERARKSNTKNASTLRKEAIEQVDIDWLRPPYELTRKNSYGRKDRKSELIVQIWRKSKW